MTKWLTVNKIFKFLGEITATGNMKLKFGKDFFFNLSNLLDRNIFNLPIISFTKKCFVMFFKYIFVYAVIKQVIFNVI
jgi:hypothetical protein